MDDDNSPIGPWLAGMAALRREVRGAPAASAEWRFNANGDATWRALVAGCYCDVSYDATTPDCPVGWSARVAMEGDGGWSCESWYATEAEAKAAAEVFARKLGGT
jgi:hypothetical protein